MKVVDPDFKDHVEEGEIACCHWNALTDESGGTNLNSGNKAIFLLHALERNFSSPPMFIEFHCWGHHFYPENFGPISEVKWEEKVQKQVTEVDVAAIEKLEVDKYNS